MPQKIQYLLLNLAFSQGAQAIELDVQLSADNKVIVFHDFSVSRTTDGSGKIRRLSLDYLKSLRASASFASVFPDARIPTLEEVLSTVNQSVYLNIELKNLNSPFDSLPDKVARIIQTHQAKNRVLISSFNPIALNRISRQLPSVPRGLLLHKPFLMDLCIYFPGMISGYQTVNVSFSCINKYRVNSLHKLGKKVFVYTLNSTADIHFALKCGVDGFFTDDPVLGLQTLSESGYNNNQYLIENNSYFNEIKK